MPSGLPPAVVRSRGTPGWESDRRKACPCPWSGSIFAGLNHDGKRGAKAPRFGQAFLRHSVAHCRRTLPEPDGSRRHPLTGARGGWNPAIVYMQHRQRSDPGEAVSREIFRAKARGSHAPRMAGPAWAYPLAGSNRRTVGQGRGGGTPRQRRIPQGGNSFGPGWVRAARPCHGRRGAAQTSGGYEGGCFEPPLARYVAGATYNLAIPVFSAPLAWTAIRRTRGYHNAHLTAPGRLPFGGGSVLPTGHRPGAHDSGNADDCRTPMDKRCKIVHRTATDELVRMALTVTLRGTFATDSAILFEMEDQ